ncbi:MAG TPA: trypsin-like peptidase domain-containing protein [Planctomycetota bacterium]|jgi:hypothetical protein
MKFLILACAVAATAVQAADFNETARKVMEQNGKGVVAIRVVSTVKMSRGGQDREQEQKAEVTGTIVDPSGLTVTCASRVDPSRQSMMGMKVDITVKETTLLMPDGTEIPAEIVLKDTDLDLAFLRPKELGKTFDAVALTAAAAPAKAMDDVFSVVRLGKNFNRVVGLESGKVKAEVKGPRPYYVCSADLSGSLGNLVYAADGNPLGIMVTKTSVGGADESHASIMTMISGGSGGAIVRPMSDLIDAIKQAKEAAGKK